MSLPRENVGLGAVVSLQEALSRCNDTFLVGGQAVWVWAEKYLSTAPELEQYKPFTSEDVDYFGRIDAAQIVAQELGGELRVPEPFSNTNSTAVVIVRVGGIEVTIDFVDHLLGVTPKALGNHIALLNIPYMENDKEKFLDLPLLNPYLCLVTKVTNYLGVLRRRDVGAKSQMQVAPIVLREYVSEMLAEGDFREVVRMMRDLGWFLRRHESGKHAHEVLENDPLSIIRICADDPRLDVRYREHQLTKMIDEIENFRGILVASDLT